MSYDNCLTKNIVSSLSKVVDDYGVSGAIAVYRAMNSYYDAEYAKWAKGVAKGNTTTGKAALLFLIATALQGKGTEVSREISSEDMDNIRIGMAEGYLETLASHPADTYISYEEMEKFHREVFENDAMKLSIENWTLYQPMRLLGEYCGGKKAQEEKWQELSKTEGEGFDSILESGYLNLFMVDCCDGEIYVDKNGRYVSSEIIADAMKFYSIPGLVGAGLYKYVAENILGCKLVELSKQDKIAAQDWCLVVDNPISIIKSISTGAWDSIKHWEEFLGYTEEDPFLIVMDDATPEEMYRNLLDGEIINSFSKQEVMDYIKEKVSNIQFLPTGVDPEAEMQRLYDLFFADITDRYLQALNDINPVVIITEQHDAKISKTLEELGEDWVKFKTWYLMEYKYKDITDEQYVNFLKSIRSSFDINPNDLIEFVDTNQPEKSFTTTSSSSNSTKHVLAFGQMLHGDADKDFLFITENGGTAFGLDGDDQLYSQASGLLLGGNGHDQYYVFTENNKVNDADGKGEVFFVLENGDKVSTSGKAYRDTSVSDQKVYLQGENIKYTLNGETLTVELINEGKTLTIEEFNNKDLNIELIERADMEIAILSDTTGSMGNDIVAVKAQAIEIINAAFDKDPNTRIGVFGYNDPSVQTFSDLSDDKDAVLAAIGKLYALDGGDIPEMTYHGIYNATQASWSETSVKRIFIFGDAPPKDTDFRGQALAALKVCDTGDAELDYIQIYTIQTGGGADTAENFKELAEATGGKYLDLQNSAYTNVADAIFDYTNEGTSRDETIAGNDKDNIIDGKGGDDTLSGGLGSDTYVETGDFGHDTIIESNPDGKDKNKVDFADTSVQDYGFENDNGNLVITNGDNSVTVNDFYGDENKVDQFVFNDAVIDNALAAFYGNNQSGKNVTYTETAENVQTGIFGGRQFVVASDDAEVNTSWFQDAVVVNGNNVSVDTGLNNDQVYVQGSGSVKTGGGSDKIFIGSEFGSVNVYDSSGVSDEINFTAHNLKDLYVSQDGKNFSFGLLGSPESVITVEAQNSLLHRIENFSFSDGTNISYKDLGALAKIYENHSYEQIATDANIAKSIEEQLSFQGFLA